MELILISDLFIGWDGSLFRKVLQGFISMTSRGVAGLFFLKAVVFLVCLVCYILDWDHSLLFHE